MPEPSTTDPNAPTKVRRGVVARLSGTVTGNILVLALTAVAVLAVVWISDVWRGGTDAGSEVDETGSVSAVDVPDSSAPAPEVGQLAPVFASSTLDGGSFDLAETDRPVWLVFNATWCANCRAEIPDVEEVHREYGEDIEIVSVYLSDSPSAAVSYSSTLDLTHTQVVDPNSEIGSLYRVMGVPSHYFIDADGVLQAIEVGVLSPTAMDEQVASLIR